MPKYFAKENRYEISTNIFEYELGHLLRFYPRAHGSTFPFADISKLAFEERRIVADGDAKQNRWSPARKRPKAS